MTEAVDWLVPLAVILPLVVALAALMGGTATWIDRVGRAGGIAAALPALAIAAVALARAGDPALTGPSWRVNGLGAVFLATTAVVGALACAVSPAYLRATPTSRAGSLTSRRLYWSVMLVFWAVLIAVPLADNLGLAWILLEGSTAASALLIAFSGKASAVEAGWKYLVLTSLGLAFTLFGIVILSVQMAPGPDGGRQPRLGPDRRGGARPGGHADRGGVRAHARGARDQGRVGARPQLAARRPQRGAAAGERAAVGGAAAHGRPDRLAPGRRPRAGGRQGHRPRPLHRLRARVAGGRRPLPLEGPAVEAPARLLEPRAHGGHRAGDRHRQPDRHRRRAGARGRSRRGQVARIRGGGAPAALPARRRPPAPAGARPPEPAPRRSGQREPGRPGGAARRLPCSSPRSWSCGVPRRPGWRGWRSWRRCCWPSASWAWATPWWRASAGGPPAGARAAPRGTRLILALTCSGGRHAPRPHRVRPPPARFDARAAACSGGRRDRGRARDRARRAPGRGRRGPRARPARSTPSSRPAPSARARCATSARPARAI